MRPILASLVLLAACSTSPAHPGPLDAGGIDAALADLPGLDLPPPPDIPPMDLPAPGDTSMDVPSSDVPQGDTGGTVGITLGPGMDIANYGQRLAQGFSTGYPDGQIGAVMDGPRWTFYASANTTTMCAGSALVQGAYRLGGDPTHLTTVYGCNAVVRERTGGPAFMPGSSQGYFDRDYVGGGPVARIRTADGRGAIVMLYRAQFQWGPLCGMFPCFYSALGLAVSLDDGMTFRSLGEVLQPHPTRAEIIGTGANLDAGSGTLVLGDANGLPVADPLAIDPLNTWFYTFYLDRDPTEGCSGLCLAVARARVSDMVTVAFGGDPVLLFSLFHKYWRGAFTEPATGRDPNDAVESGHFTPLLPVPVTSPSVLYDRTLGGYLMAAEAIPDIQIRTATDLLHWSAPIPGATIHEPGNVARYPSLLGDTGDPAIGGPLPWLLYVSGPAGTNWAGWVLREHVLQVSRAP